MSTKLIPSTQLSLWNEVVPAVKSKLAVGLLGAEHSNKKGVMTSQSVRLIPVTAGQYEDGTNKPSLAVAFPKLTKDELVAKQNGTALEMKRWLLQQVGATILNDDTIGGVALTVSKSKRLSMSFKTLVPQVALKSDIEYASELGCSVEQVAAIRKAPQPLIEVASPEPAAAPTKKSKKQAAVAPPAA